MLLQVSVSGPPSPNGMLLMPQMARLALSHVVSSTVREPQDLVQRGLFLGIVDFKDFLGYRFLMLFCDRFPGPPTNPRTLPRSHTKPPRQSPRPILEPFWLIFVGFILDLSCSLSTSYLIVVLVWHEGRKRRSVFFARVLSFDQDRLALIYEASRL